MITRVSDYETKKRTTADQIYNDFMCEIPRDKIYALLPMYKPENIFISKATFMSSTLTAEFDTFIHPFTIKNPKHLTREHVLIYVTQASYIYAAMLFNFRKDWGSSTEEFIKLALDEQTIFTRIDMRFRRFIRNHNGIVMTIRCIEERFLRGKLFLKCKFTFPDGCDGICEGLIAFDKSLLPGKTELKQP